MTQRLTNPFLYKTRVPPERFIGRKQEVYLILDRLVNPFNQGGAAVSGRRGVGKTSLLQYLGSCASELRPELAPETVHFVNIPVDTMVPFSVVDFWRFLFLHLEQWPANQFKQQTRDLLSILDKHASASRHPITTFFETIGKAQLVVVLLDNFDLILEQIQPETTSGKRNKEQVEYLNFLGTIAALLNLPAPRGFSLIVASEQPVYDLLTQCHQSVYFGSAFYNNMVSLPLRSFSRAECEELLDTYLKGTEINFEVPARDKLYEVSGGHPATFQEAAYNLFKEVTAQPEEAMPIPGSERRTPLSDRRIDFVLVTALEEERDAILDKLPGYRKLSPVKNDIRIYFQAELPVIFPGGEAGAYRVIVMPLLGMGRVQAAAATKDAIARWHPRYVVLAGIAGGLAAQGINIGDILIADQIVDYELQKVTPQGAQVRWEVHRADPRLLNACRNFIGESWQELVQLERPDQGKLQRHTGPIASGDKVIAFGDVLERYREIWPKLIGVEMEAAGVAAATFQSPDPPGFFVVRCVSDLADEHKDSVDVKKWRAYACDAAASFAIALLKSGPVNLSTADS